MELSLLPEYVGIWFNPFLTVWNVPCPAGPDTAPKARFSVYLKSFEMYRAFPKDDGKQAVTPSGVSYLGQSYLRIQISCSSPSFAGCCFLLFTLNGTAQEYSDTVIKKQVHDSTSCFLEHLVMVYLRSWPFWVECSVFFCRASEQTCTLAQLAWLNAPGCEWIVCVSCDKMHLFCFREAFAPLQWI